MIVSRLSAPPGAASVSATPGWPRPSSTTAAGYSDAAEKGRLFRWFLIFILVVAVGTAVWDAVYGSWGNAVASVIYLVMLLLELFWWPKRLEQLLANTDRAADIAAHLLENQGAGRSDR